jgi:RimJ/RimL family protein N-acetyltransferase
MTTLVTGRLILRRWQESDREPFAALNADIRVMEFFPGKLSRRESNKFVDRIESHFEQHGFGLYATELSADQSFIGYIGLAIPQFTAAFTPCVEVGWRLAGNHWGKGLATEGAREVLRLAFGHLKLDSLVSYTVPANVRSRRVMEKLGMSNDPVEDFEHPQIPEGHPLRRHVLYRLRRVDWLRADQEWQKAPIAF